MADSAGIWRSYSDDCTWTSSCDDYFDLYMPAGTTLEVSLCSNGGWANWDTTLGVYSGPGFSTLETCDDDYCALFGPSEIYFQAPSSGTYRIRVGGWFGDSGPYTIGYRWSQSATLGAGCVDLDGDGHCNDVDCNDFNSAVYPGASETLRFHRQQLRFFCR